MRRLILLAAAVALLMALLAPAVLAAEPGSATRQVLLSVNGPVEVPAGDHVDLLVVIGGDARISGDVGTIVVAGGTATLTGATARSLVVVDGSADLRAGTTVTGDVRTLGGTVAQQPGATIGGSVRTLDVDIAALGLILVVASIVLFLGLGLAAIALALLVAAFAARQVREVESLISRQPGQVLVAGIGGAVILPILAVLLTATIIGAPIGLGLLLVVLPAAALLAWLVAAIWIGDWIAARLRGAPESGRPYRAAVLGVFVLAAAGLVPFVTVIATLFGFGALLLAAWRVLRGEAPASGEAPAPGGAPAPGNAGSAQPAPSAS
jgi:hypothetical protein